MEKQVWYDMLRFTDTEESAEAYLMKHLEIESFRRIAVETALRREQYETAEKLCREFLDQHTPSVTGGLWERWLLQIYILWGNKEKQVRQLWKLYTLGDSAYWGELKTVLQEQGSWEKAYPILLIEARKTLSVSEYSALLAEENEVDLLMELVRQEPQRCIRFAEKLFPAYRIEICLLCTEELLHLSQEACNRKEYAAVCSQVEALYRIGAKEEMMDLIARLKAAYPRRPAFQDELNRLESRL